MTEYGVSTRNKFAFLEEDASDPEEVLTKTMESKKEKDIPKKASPVVAPQPQKPIEKAETRMDRNKPKEGSERQAPRDGQNRSGQPQRRFPPRTYNKEDQEGRGDRDQRQPVRQFNNSDRPPRRRSGDENAPPRDSDDRGQPRGPRRFDGQPRRYERKDGETNAEGVGYRGQRDQRGGYQRQGQFNRRPYNREDKRDGQDQNVNTGDVQNVVEKTNELETPTGNESEQVETNVNPEEKPLNGETDEQGEDKANEEPAEPEPIVKTLEEWKAETKKAETPQFNLRKPGEGADQKIYQKLQPIKQETTGKEKEIDEDHHSHKEKREKALNIEIQFSDAKRGGTDRGGFDRDRPPYTKRGGGSGGDGSGYRGSGGDGYRGGDSGYRGGRGEDGGFRGGGQRGPPREPRGPPREGNNTERGGYRGGGRGGSNYSGGAYRGQPRAGPSGGSVRPPPGFNIENEQFPELGAVKN